MSKINELLDTFHDIANNPRRQMDKYLNSNHKVVLCSPIYTPEELIHAMDMVPMGTWGSDVKLESSKKYFPTFICSVMQSIVECGINGKYQGASAVMIPSFCDSMQAMGENWKYAVPSIPIIACDFPHNRKIKAGFDFVKATYQSHINQLEEISGKRFDIEKLRNTNKIYNHHNKLMIEVSEILSHHSEILPSQRSDIFKSALFMLKEEHSKLVESLLIELKRIKKVNNDEIRIITTGIQMDLGGLLKIFDDFKLHIVADDIAQESRQYLTDTPACDNPIDALSQKFCNRDYCSILYDIEKKRLNRIVDLFQNKHAHGVVYIQTKFCDPEEFDYVPMKELLAKHKIPLLMIEVDRQMDHFEQVRTQIQTFVEMLKA